MISPRPGVAFTDAADGDLRGDPERRRDVSAALGIHHDWAFAEQVHGVTVVEATTPGSVGPADALFTTVPHLPLAVFTADCLAVCLVGPAGAGVAHAGWRGMAGGIVRALAETMTRAGAPPEEAHAGPAIRACCFEVGTEVGERFSGHGARTSWGAQSVDLLSAAAEQLDGLELRVAGGCTVHDQRYPSHRRDGSVDRMAAISWREA